MSSTANTSSTGTTLGDTKYLLDSHVIDQLKSINVMVNSTITTRITSSEACNNDSLLLNSNNLKTSKITVNHSKSAVMSNDTTITGDDDANTTDGTDDEIKETRQTIIKPATFTKIPFGGSIKMSGTVPVSQNQFHSMNGTSDSGYNTVAIAAQGPRRVSMMNSNVSPFEFLEDYFRHKSANEQVEILTKLETSIGAQIGQVQRMRTNLNQLDGKLTFAIFQVEVLQVRIRRLSMGTSQKRNAKIYVA